MRKKIFLYIIIGLFLVGITGSIYMYASGFKFEDFFSRGNFSIYTKIGIISLLYVFRNYLFIPSTLLILLTGFILQDFWLTLIISEIGVSIGILQTYLVGRTLGGEFEKSKKFDLIKKYQEKIEKNGFKVIFFGSLIPIIPVDLIYYAAAMSKYDIKKFLLAGILGETPLIILYSYLGIEAEKYIHIIAIVFGILGTLYIGYLWYQKKKREKI